MVLPSQQAISTSLSIRSPIASVRAVATRSIRCATAKSWKAWFDWLTAFAFQKFAIAVCLGERTVLSTAPYALTSLNSRAQPRLDSDGGGAERNCDGLLSMNGFITATHGVWADCSDGGGANVQAPGASGPGVKVIDSSRSPVRWAIRSSAAASPTSTPAATRGEAGPPSAST